MVFPLVVAFASVALGTGLAFATHARPVRWLRWVAIAAAVAVVAVHLVPEAFAALGARALLAFAIGIVAPALIERAVSVVVESRVHHRGHHGALAALEIGYAGLVAHRFGDGVSMGAYFLAGNATWAAASVVLALAAHIVPVTTVMILAILSLRGKRSALLRAFGLGAATMGGVVAARIALPDGAHETLSAWISAAVAGLLLHIVAHDVPKAHPEVVG